MLLYQETIISVLNKLLNQTPKIRKGTDAVYHCPSCKHYKRKLEINLHTGKYNCWVCGFSGTSFKTLFKKLNAPSEYYTSIGLSQKSTFKKSITEFSISFEDEPEELKLVKLPKEFKPISEPTNELEYKHAVKYLKSRNITKNDIIRYNIGYCTEGELKNRIVIPSYDSNGTLNFYTARSFFETKGLKYVSCSASKNIIGFELFTTFEQPITLVEGPFDAINLKNNCIPLFVKTMSRQLKLKLLENDVPMVHILLDNDALKDSVKICDFLIKNSIPAKLVMLDGKDPSVIGFEKTWQLINSCDTMDFEKLFKLKINI